MADARVVSVKFEQIEEYHAELQEKRRELSREDLPTDTTQQRAIERMFENVIQASADLAQHVATRDFEYTESVPESPGRAGRVRRFQPAGCEMVPQQRLTPDDQHDDCRLLREPDDDLHEYVRRYVEDGGTCVVRWRAESDR